jgi:tRNA A37 threonylcarbamoyladenosine dehydratase
LETAKDLLGVSGGLAVNGRVNQFLRTQMLLGAPAMARLTTARVVVVGLGAVGSYAAEALARAGVGHLRLVDFDEIRPTNLNRQLYALHSTLGRAKAEVARERILDINPRCEVEALKVFGDQQTRPHLLAGADALVDAIDSVGPKFGLLRDAFQAGIPIIISSMGAAERTDPTQIRVADLAKTDRCPLARFMRKRLRTVGIKGGITCVFSTELPRKTPRAMQAAALENPAEKDVLERGRQRKPLGSLPTLTGIFGLTAANVVIMRIAGKKPDEVTT